MHKTHRPPHISLVALILLSCSTGWAQTQISIGPEQWRSPLPPSYREQHGHSLLQRVRATMHLQHVTGGRSTATSRAASNLVLVTDVLRSAQVQVEVWLAHDRQLRSNGGRQTARTWRDSNGLLRIGAVSPFTIQVSNALGASFQPLIRIGVAKWDVNHRLSARRAGEDGPWTLLASGWSTLPVKLYGPQEIPDAIDTAFAVSFLCPPYQPANYYDQKKRTWTLEPPAWAVIELD